MIHADLVNIGTIINFVDYKINGNDELIHV